MLARLRFEHVEGIVIASPEGEIDMSNAAELQDALSRRTSNDARGLVLDLSGVTYLDSAAVEAIFDLREELGRRDQRLALAVPPGARIATAVEATGLSAEVLVAATPDEALRDLED
jgi:anti-anti-sigma factor